MSVKRCQSYYFSIFFILHNTPFFADSTSDTYCDIFDTQPISRTLPPNACRGLFAYPLINCNYGLFCRNLKESSKHLPLMRPKIARKLPFFTNVFILLPEHILFSIKQTEFINYQKSIRNISGHSCMTDSCGAIRPSWSMTNDEIPKP